MVKLRNRIRLTAAATTLLGRLALLGRLLGLTTLAGRALLFGGTFLFGRLLDLGFASDTLLTRLLGRLALTSKNEDFRKLKITARKL